MNFQALYEFEGLRIQEKERMLQSQKEGSHTLEKDSNEETIGSCI